MTNSALFAKLPCGAPYGLAPLDHGRADTNWNNNNCLLRQGMSCSARLGLKQVWLVVKVSEYLG